MVCFTLKQSLFQCIQKRYTSIDSSILLSSDPEFVRGLKYRFERVKSNKRNIEDVYDGSLYKSKCGPDGFLSKQYNISLKLNTDGVAIFHSSQFGVWPLFLLINELPPSLRYCNYPKELFELLPLKVVL